MASINRVFAFVICALLPAASAVGMMRKEAKATPEGKLRHSLETVLKGAAAKRLFAVEEIVRPTFEAFAKNSVGKVPVPAIHAIVRAYFMETHGWLISGFEFQSQKSTQVQQSLVLQEKAPEVAKALDELQKLDHGLSLSDVVAICAAIEHMLLDESLTVLNGAYALNKFSVSEPLDESSVDEVLSSYLVLFRDAKRNISDFRRHDVLKAHAKKHEADWASLVSFEREVITSSGHSGEQYSFYDAAMVARELTLKYGDWQNSECSEIKNRLVDLQDDGSGRVPFQAFHDEPPHAHYRFTESLEYLRNISAIDDTEDGNPKVYLANYVAAPSNCIASSKYYSVCCLSECEYVMNEVESEVQSSEVPLQKLLDTVASISTTTVAAPRDLNSDLVIRATTMVDNHDGLVPLHSGDFKLFLHHAFPNECPYPTRYEKAVEDKEHEAADIWLGHNRMTQWQVSADAALLTV